MGSQPSSPAWQGRSIATQKLRLVEFSAYVEHQRDPDTYNKHLFVHIGGPVTYSDPLLEVKSLFTAYTYCTLLENATDDANVKLYVNILATISLYLINFFVT